MPKPSPEAEEVLAYRGTTNGIGTDVVLNGNRLHLTVSAENGLPPRNKLPALVAGLMKKAMENALKDTDAKVADLVANSPIISRTLRTRITNSDTMRGVIADVMTRGAEEGFTYDRALASLEIRALKELGELEPIFVEDPDYPPRVQDVFGPGASEATAKLTVSGVQKHIVAEGNGPVKALAEVLRKSIIETHPELRNLKMVDFHVEKSIKSNEGAASVVQFLIDWTDGESSWTTAGLSSNILEASWNAFKDGMRYKMAKDAVAAENLQPF